MYLKGCITMKKIITLILAITMAFVSVVPAFAVEDGFVSSPSSDDVVLIEGENEDPECTAELVLTLFKDRDKLEAYVREQLEKAFEIISNCEDLTTLCKEFAQFVKTLGLTGKDLAVAELFDLSYYSCDTHNEHGYFTIKVGAKVLKNFVGLLHYNNGEWEFVDNARVLPDGETLEFRIKDFSPFAIVVNTSGKVPNQEIPNTDVQNPQMPMQLLVGAAAVLATATVIAVVFKKKEVKE